MTHCVFCVHVFFCTVASSPKNIYPIQNGQHPQLSVIGLTVSYFVFCEIRNCVKQVTVSPVTAPCHSWSHCFAMVTDTGHCFGHCFAEMQSYLEMGRNIWYGNFSYFYVKLCFSSNFLLFERVLHLYIF